MKGEKITFNCGHCGREVMDYKCNRRPTKTGEWFCTQQCAGEGRRAILSLLAGGDGILRSKAEKDRLHYENNVDARREQATGYYRANRLDILQKKRDQDRAAKQQVVDAYGGECVCCGEKMIEFLTIDHIDGRGHLHRKKVGKGRRIYKDLIALGFPKDNYRLLCFNCNIVRGFYGYCPHHPEDRQEVSHVPHKPGRPRTVAV